MELVIKILLDLLALEVVIIKIRAPPISVDKHDRLISI